MNMDEAVAYYREHNLKGQHAMQIEGLPGVIGLTDEKGGIQPLMEPSREWKIESTSGAHTTADGFVVSPERR